MSDTVKFKISSALKNLIGKELITDQYIAIFELVKNSFDAYANNVKITFKDIYTDHPKIIIEDDGKGMDFHDLINKWLFVAYSAKQDGTEDIENTGDPKSSRNDYRSKIKNKRIFAGAKGVGRFSCDRLGSSLNLITRKNNPDSIIENIRIDWEDFEQDSKKEFVDVELFHQVIQDTQMKFKHGTILEISNLRDQWNRESLKKLKRSLQKLINPNQENDVSAFSIEIIAEEERENDLKEKDQLIKRAKDKAKDNEFDLEDISGEIDFHTVNGNVKNFVFELLGVKSVQIVSSISQDGKIIETTLRDQGSLIYKIAEKTTYSLSNIKIHLFFLNRAAKANFTRLMGVEPVNYGSVFIYKNGFRVYPYGEAGEDFFGIDKRKAQGFKRYLGTREILGRIEIIGPNESFKESTSRDGGFIKNEAYFELESFFTKTVRLLERYVVDTISWGDLSLFDDEWLEPKEALSRLEEVIRRMTNLREVLSIEYDSNLINKLKEKQKKSASAIIHEIKQIALKNENDTLLKNIEKVDKELRSAIETKSLAEQEAEESRELLRKTNAELKLKTEQNLFLKSVTSLDFDNILSLHHQIGIYANDIDAQLLYWNRQLNKGNQLSIDELRTLLENIGFANKKILSIVKFATKANFKLTSEKIEADLILFIKQYIENIYTVYVDAPIKINLIHNTDESFFLKFKPIEITIILDNLISNSRKANARLITVQLYIESNNLYIIYKDDGKGLDKNIVSTEVIFEKGFTTTMGSGLGLFHVKQILNEMNSSIKVNSDIEKGFELVIEVKR